MGDSGVYDEPDADDRHPELSPDQQTPAVDRVGKRTADERERQ